MAEGIAYHLPGDRYDNRMAKKLSRRELGITALAAAMMAQAQEEPLNADGLDPVYWTQMRHDSAPMRMTFRAENRKQAEAWQKKLRVKLTELLGGFPESKTPLNVRIVATKEFPTYKRERFLFTSRPGVTVAG